MRGAITLVLALVLLVVIVLDGYGMFVAFQDSRQLALGAAQQAALTFQNTGSEADARVDSDAYAAANGGELVKLDYGKYQSEWYRATVRVEPKTFVFQFIPGLNRFLVQESTSSYTF